MWRPRDQLFYKSEILQLLREENRNKGTKIVMLIRSIQSLFTKPFVVSPSVVCLSSLGEGRALCNLQGNLRVPSQGQKASKGEVRV